MNYAAAIGDDNSAYFDDENREGIIAPPMFSVAATWPVIENLAQYLATDDFPHEILLTQVHYTEHLMFHRPIRPDEELTIQGVIAAIVPHRAGTHVVIRFEARNQNQTQGNILPFHRYGFAGQHDKTAGLRKAIRVQYRRSFF